MATRRLAGSYFCVDWRATAEGEWALLRRAAMMPEPALQSIELRRRAISRLRLAGAVRIAGPSGYPSIAGVPIPLGSTRSAITGHRLHIRSRRQQARATSAETRGRASSPSANDHELELYRPFQKHSTDSVSLCMRSTKLAPGRGRSGPLGHESVWRTNAQPRRARATVRRHRPCSQSRKSPNCRLTSW